MSGIRTLGLVLIAALALPGCGGGSGEDGNAGNEDIFPDGARIDLRAKNYFPAALGDTWTYDALDLSPGGMRTLVSRQVTAVDDDGFVMTELPGRDAMTYRRTTAGIVIIDPFGATIPSSARGIIGDILDYPEPFYPVGSTRRHVRTGSWGEDLDEDGRAETFRLELFFSSPAL